MQVTDLEVDLHDGLLLIELLQKLAAPKEVGRYNKRCVNNVQMIENLGNALRFIFSQNIKLVNIGEWVYMWEQCASHFVNHIQIFISLFVCVNDAITRMN